MRVSPSRRRALLALAAFGAGARLARAQGTQAAKPRRVALLSLEPPADFKGRFDAFRKGMRALGYAEGRDVAYELRSANGDAGKLATLAEALAKDAFDVIVSSSSLTTLALRKATTALPIVIAACDDPLASRFVRSLEKPETNVTGLTAFLRDETPGPVELIARLVPKGAPVAGIFNPANATYRKHRAGFHFGALKAGLAPVYLDALDASQIDEAFAAAARERAAGVVVMNDPLFLRERRRFVKRAAGAGRPVVYPQREYVQAGGLMSFGPNLERNFERAAGFVDRILKGAAPGELAVEAPARYELVVNRKAARAQKITIPDDVMKRADQAIA